MLEININIKEFCETLLNINTDFISFDLSVKWNNCYWNGPSSTGKSDLLDAEVAASIKPRLLIFHAGYASWGLSRFSV